MSRFERRLLWRRSERKTKIESWWGIRTWEGNRGKKETRNPRLSIVQNGPDLNRRFSAELLKRLLQLRRDVERFTVFDIAALHHVHELAVPKNSDRRRRWRIAGKI